MLNDPKTKQPTIEPGNKIQASNSSIKDGIYPGDLFIVVKACVEPGTFLDELITEEWCH